MSKITASAKGEISLEFDRETQEYYVIWQPVVIATGRTEQETLEDLRTTAHSGIDTWINLKKKDIMN